MDKYEKLEALMNDAAFEQELAMVESTEDLQEVLLNHGVELTADELRQLVAMAENKAELSENDLDYVTGGALIPTLLIWIIKHMPRWNPRILPRR